MKIKNKKLKRKNSVPSVPLWSNKFLKTTMTRQDWLKTWQDLAELVKKWQNGSSWDMYELSSIRQANELRKMNGKLIVKHRQPVKWSRSTYQKLHSLPSIRHGTIRV